MLCHSFAGSTYGRSIGLTYRRFVDIPRPNKECACLLHFCCRAYGIERDISRNPFQCNWTNCEGLPFWGKPDCVDRRPPGGRKGPWVYTWPFLPPGGRHFYANPLKITSFFSEVRGCPKNRFFRQLLVPRTCQKNNPRFFLHMSENSISPVPSEISYPPYV